MKSVILYKGLRVKPKILLKKHFLSGLIFISDLLMSCLFVTVFLDFTASIGPIQVFGLTLGLIQKLESGSFGSFDGTL